MSTNLVDVDLISMIEQDLGPGRRYGRWTLFHCPFHSPDRHPSLGVTNGDERGPHWKCFSCSRNGGPIEWLEGYRALTKREAINALSGVVQSVGYRPAIEPSTVPDYPPSLEWQAGAYDLIKWAEGNLWDEKGRDFEIDWPGTNQETGEKMVRRLSALEWLMKFRGLTEQTLKAWHIGYIPVYQDKHYIFESPEDWGFTGKPIVIAAGVLIPCIIDKDIWYLKIRRPMDSPNKYSQVKGSRPALYMAQTVSTHETVIFCEGELDTLLLWQAVGDLTGVVTLGSAGAAFSVATWGINLVHTRERFVAYHADQAGQLGNQKLDWLHPQQLIIPQLRPYDKDVTDFRKSGGDLRSLVITALFSQGSQNHTPTSQQEALQGLSEEL